MDLYGTLFDGFSSDRPFISLTGGGGKTTLMANLAAWFRARGKRVLMTTTTKIMSPYVHDYGAERIFGDDEVLSYRPAEPVCVLYAISDEVTRKWTSPSLETLESLRDRYDVVINEADGSRRLPFKVHTQRDPVVPDYTTDTVSVTGLWGIGKKASEVSFGDGRDVVIDAGYLQWYVDDPQGLLKGSIPGCRTVLFNGADDCPDWSVLSGLRFPDDVRVFVCSEKEGKIYDRIC